MSYTLEYIRDSFFYTQRLIGFDKNIKLFFTKEELNVLRKNIEAFFEAPNVQTKKRFSNPHFIVDKNTKGVLLHYDNSDAGQYSEEILHLNFSFCLTNNKNQFYNQDITPRTVGISDVEEVYEIDGVWLFMVVWQGKNRRKHLYINKKLIRTTTFLGKRSQSLKILLESFD